MKLFPGFEEEYKKRHDNLWPELKDLLKKSGVREYSIYLDDSSLTLFGVMQVEDPALLQNIGEHPVMKKWWAYMQDIMETNPDNSPQSAPLKEVFYLS
jgi:L-rhamnose mutarotase